MHINRFPLFNLFFQKFTISSRSTNWHWPFALIKRYFKSWMIQHAMTIFKRFIFYSNYLVLSEKDCMGLLCNVWNRSWKTPIWGKDWSSRVLDFMKYKLNMSKYVDSKIEKLLNFFSEQHDDIPLQIHSGNVVCIEKRS